MFPFARTALALTLALGSAQAMAVQETFTDAGVLDCSLIQVCQQATTDGLFVLRFKPAFPWSAPSPLGFEVREKAVEIRPANGGVLDLGSMSVSLSGSNAYNGSQFIGAVRMDVQAADGTWSNASQWSSWVGSPMGIYVVFNGHNAQSPLVQGVRAIRLTGVNGTTGFRIGMMNLSAR